MGTFKLTLNGETTDAIAYDASAADIKAALEALAGVEVGDVDVTGSDLPAGNIAIEFTGNLAGQDITKMTVSEDGSLDAGVISVGETTKGNDGWLHRNSNSITNALKGITLNLQDVTDVDDPVTVTISRNTSTISGKVQAMVNAYNELMTDLKTKTEYDVNTKKLGALSTDVAASFLKAQTATRNPFATIAAGFLESMDEFVQAGDIGLTFDGAGMMEFDAEAFNEAINDDYQSVLELLESWTKSGKSSDSSVQFYNSSDKYTTAGIYHIKVEVDSSGEIVSAQIKLSTESAYRDAASWDGNVISFNSSFDENGEPLYPEHSLQLTVLEGTCRRVLTGDG